MYKIVSALRSPAACITETCAAAHWRAESHVGGSGRAEVEDAPSLSSPLSGSGMRSWLCGHFARVSVTGDKNGEGSKTPPVHKQVEKEAHEITHTQASTSALSEHSIFASGELLHTRLWIICTQSHSARRKRTSPRRSRSRVLSPPHLRQSSLR